jgi:hypothetical protein
MLEVLSPVTVIPLVASSSLLVVILRWLGCRLTFVVMVILIVCFRGWLLFSLRDGLSLVKEVVSVLHEVDLLKKQINLLVVYTFLFEDIGS